MGASANISFSLMLLDVQASVCYMALRVGDESTRVGGKKEVKIKSVDTSSPHGLTSGTINRERNF